MPQFAAISSFLGSIKNRYVNYQNDRTLTEKMELASKIQGLKGLEVCYPADFQNEEELLHLLEKYQLGVSAINFRSRRTGQWMRGSFTSSQKTEQREVTEDLMKAMDYARKLGCNRVTTCPLNEGHDYIFEMDYEQAYDAFEECIRTAALHDPNVKICIEYKMNDPRARCFLGNAGETLAFCQSVGLPNVGVTLDIGHSIQAGERPAQSAVMLARAGRLFYVHLNDNDKFWDWDMLPGAYNIWDFVEFFYYLKKIGYQDWFAFDLFPKECDTVQTFSTAFEMTEKLMTISERLDDSEIGRLLAARNPVESMRYLLSLVR